MCSRESERISEIFMLCSWMCEICRGVRERRVVIFQNWKVQNTFFLPSIPFLAWISIFITQSTSSDDNVTHMSWVECERERERNFPIFHARSLRSHRVEKSQNENLRREGLAQTRTTNTCSHRTLIQSRWDVYRRALRSRENRENLQLLKEKSGLNSKVNQGLV